MSFSIQWDLVAEIVVATCSGELGIDEAKEGAAAVWARQDWEGRPVVWDFRQARLDVRAPQVRQFAQYVLQHQPRVPPARIALVTARDVDFGLARMFEV